MTPAPESPASHMAAFIVGSVERMLAHLDSDPTSPTYGCAHLAYWRDKTSEVADMRRQEAALAFAMLYVRPYPGNSWQGSPRLLAAIEALLSFWSHHRYADGSLDEWYKGERAFAAAAFTSHAMARCLLTLPAGTLNSAVESDARHALRSTAHWLAGRDDLFKTNHQAVGVGALAFAGKVLDDEALTQAAKDKLASILAAQTPEGWFPEVGHCDPGYVFLTAEYVAGAMDLWGDWRHVASMARALDFAAHWVHPDLTVGDEYGVCHNPFVSSIAAALLAPYSAAARHLTQYYSRPASKPHLDPMMRDDLRLMRWAFQPLLAYDLLARLPDASDAIWVRRDQFCPEAGLIRLERPSYACVIASAAGGLVRILTAKDTMIADHGIATLDGSRYATNQTYDRGLGWRMDSDTFVVGAAIAPVRKFMPSFLSRVILRILCSTAIGSKWTRRGIDLIRKRKGTALNQSSANLSSQGVRDRLRRRIAVGEDHVSIIDEIELDHDSELFQVVSDSASANKARLLSLGQVRAGRVRLSKRLTERGTMEIGDLEVLAGAQG